MAQFIVRPLKTSELESAWPIVRWSNVYANMDWWLTDAAELIASGGGALVAINPDGEIHGVATFKTPRDPASDNLLKISMLITFELSSGAPARHALLKALERIATRLECTHVVVPLAGNFPALSPWKFLASA